MSEAHCEVWFYHLERSGLDQVLPDLLERTLGRGWRAIVRTREPDRIEHLDGWLWAYRDDSFLPHGRARTDAAKHPVLLSTEAVPTNNAKVALLLDGLASGEALVAALHERRTSSFNVGRPVVALNRGGAGTNPNWEKAYQAAFADFLARLDAELTYAGL